MAFRLILHQQTIAYSQRQAILIFHLHERLKSFSQKNLSFTVFPLISVSYPAFSYPLYYILYCLKIVEKMYLPSEKPQVSKKAMRSVLITAK